MRGNMRSSSFKIGTAKAVLTGCNNGFTLVELVIAVSLTAVICVSLSGFLISSAISWRQNYDRLEVRENLRLGMNQLTRELRQSGQIVSFSNAGGGRLTFITSDGDTITYYRNTSGDPERAYQLARSINGAGNNPVARYIKKIEVSPENCNTHTRTVHITLVGEKGTSGEIPLTTCVTIRRSKS